MTKKKLYHWLHGLESHIIFDIAHDINSAYEEDIHDFDKEELIEYILQYAQYGVQKKLWTYTKWYKEVKEVYT